MAAQIEACRALMYHVCTQIDSGRRCDKEAAMVKYLAAEMAEKVTSEGVQIMAVPDIRRTSRSSVTGVMLG